MKQLKFVIADPAGLHARPASVLAKEAGRFQSDIKVNANGRIGNLKSVLGIMSLGIQNGQTVEISVEGADEGDAIAAIESLLASEGLA